MNGVVKDHWKVHPLPGTNPISIRALKPAGSAQSLYPVNKLYRPAVLAAVGVGRSTLYALIAAGGFPQPIKLTPSGRAVAWPSSVVKAWIDERINPDGGEK